MPSLLESSKRILRRTIKAAAGIRVRYHSAVTGLVYETGDDGGPLIATLDGSGRDQETEEGVSFTEALKDFKLDVADLPVMPQRLDRVEPLEGELAGTWWQVVPTSGVGAAEDYDHHRIAWTVHCKEIPAPEPMAVAYGSASGNFAFGVAAQDFAYGNTSVL